MARNIHQIRIDSILGGHSKYSSFAAEDEFSISMGIDPDIPITSQSSGYIIPSASPAVVGTPYDDIYWLVPNPKIREVFVYGANGTLATTTALGSGFTLMTALTGANGNGAAYYDNYVYFAKNTTVARWGPLDGTPSMTTDYWVGTLGKTALTDTGYPFIAVTGFYPNHPMLRHSDGKLYFADVVGNQGVLHCLATTKTTVEGDTDNGSTFNAIDFPYGMLPTALASYGTDIAVALFEGNSGGSSGLNVNKNEKAKIAFWNPTNSTAYDKIVFVEFPDEIISALVNANGILYAFSGSASASTGLRVSRFVGGYSFEQVGFYDYIRLPFPGAARAVLNRILFSANIDRPEDSPAVLSIGSRLSSVSNALFNVAGDWGTSSQVPHSLLEIGGAAELGLLYDDGNNSLLYSHQVVACDATSTTSSMWESRQFPIGQPFKVTKLRINTTNVITGTGTITPYIVVDDDGTTHTLTSISSAFTKKGVTIRPENATGELNFRLGLQWSGNTVAYDGGEGYNLVGVKLPITIEYELLDD